MYRFPPPDSDFGLRGAHILPRPKVVGIEVHDETIECSRIIEGLGWTSSQSAHHASSLREMPDEAARAALNDLLVRVRLAS